MNKNYNDRIRAIAGIKYYGENQLSHGGQKGSTRVDICADLTWKGGTKYFKQSKYLCKVQGMKNMFIKEEQIVWFATI